MVISGFNSKFLQVDRKFHSVLKSLFNGTDTDPGFAPEFMVKIMNPRRQTHIAAVHGPQHIKLDHDSKQYKT